MYTQDEFGNWEVDPKWEDLLDRLECDTPVWDGTEEDHRPCGECARCKA